MEHKVNHPVGQLGNPIPKNLLYDNATFTQRKRLVRRFEENPMLSTMEARELLGILHPSARVMELRRKGYRIETHWVNEADINGVLHRVGLYVYKGREKVIHEK